MTSGHIHINSRTVAADIDSMEADIRAVERAIDADHATAAGMPTLFGNPEREAILDRVGKTQERLADLKREYGRECIKVRLLPFLDARNLRWRRFHPVSGSVGSDGRLEATSKTGEEITFPLDVITPEIEPGELGPNFSAERRGEEVGMMRVKDRPGAVREAEEAAVRQWCVMVLGREDVTFV